MTTPLTDRTDYNSIGFLTVTTAGCSLRFNIEQTVYRLDRDRDNYNAMYSLLLGSYLAGKRVSVYHRTITEVGGDGAYEILEVYGLAA